MNEFNKRTASIKSKITALTDYSEFKKLSTKEIAGLYRTLYSVYFYDISKLNKLTLRMDKVSADSGFQIMGLLSQTSLGPNFDLLPMLKTIKAPTLVIHGAQDIIPAQIPEQIKDTIPGARLIYLPECGHFSYVEQPEHLFAIIRDFLR